MGFQVGDRVRLISDCSGLKKGAVCILHDPYRDGDLFASPTGNSIEGNNGCSCKWNWELISRKGEVMSKYDELKARIEKVEGWTKEADQLFTDMGVQHELRFSQDAQSGYGSLSVNVRGYVSKFAKFDYSSQCSKNTAFKQALMWLLDNSSIKKDDKSEKIAELEKKCEELKEEIRNLKGRY